MSNISNRQSRRSRLIFGSDFDGTYFYKGAISEADANAVSALRESGGKFGIASGRNAHEAMVGIVPLLGGNFDFVICGNGSVCFLPDGSLLYERLTGGNALGRLFDCAVEMGADYMFFDVSGCTGGVMPDNKLYLADGEEGDSPIPLRMSVYLYGGESDDPAKYRRSGRVRMAAMDEFDYFTQCSIVSGNPDKARRMCGELAERFRGELEFHLAHTCIDITRAGVNKASGLALYADTVDVPHSRIYTAGDSLNDMAMIKAYKGFVMADCNYRELMDAAYKIIPSVHDAIEGLLIGELSN